MFCIYLYATFCSVFAKCYVGKLVMNCSQHGLGHVCCEHICIQTDTVIKKKSSGHLNHNTCYPLCVTLNNFGLTHQIEQIWCHSTVDNVYPLAFNQMEMVDGDITVAASVVFIQLSNTLINFRCLFFYFLFQKYTLTFLSFLSMYNFQKFDSFYES